MINDMRFVMRILGVATARCAKLKLRCLIYRRREDAFSRGRKINCDLQATRWKTVGKARPREWEQEREQDKEKFASRGREASLPRRETACVAYTGRVRRGKLAVVKKRG